MPEQTPSPSGLTKTGRLWVGTAGWSYEDWAGIVYPQPAPRGFRPLEYLAGFFDCIEVNVTFYRLPDRRWVEGWIRQVRDRREFQFLIKLHQEFTHGSEPWERARAREFQEPLAPLREAGRWAALLVQLPWSAREDDRTRDRLKRIAEAFSGVPRVLEVRHASWGTAEAREWMRRHGYEFCNIDQPALRDCLGPSDHTTGDLGYVRLHGRNRETWFQEDAGRDRRYDYLYSDSELEEWVPRIRALLAAAPNVYVIGNNHYRGKAPANALQLQAKVTGEKVRIPPPLRKAYPELTDIARPDPPGDAPPPGPGGGTKRDSGTASPAPGRGRGKRGPRRGAGQRPDQPGLFDALEG